MLVSGPFGSNISSKFFVDEGVPVIRGNNLSLGEEKYKDTGYVFVTEEKAYELRNCNVQRDDVLFTAAGTLGQVGILRGDLKYDRYIISNKQIRMRCNREVVDPLFLYYFLSWKYMRDFIASQNKGSSIPLLTLGSIKWIPIPTPPLDIQQKIAAVLSAYDDLIENNLKRIKLLEEMAQITYEEWFVRMKFPGHESVAVDAETGLPEGWKKVPLGKVITLNYGKSLRAEERNGGKIPVYGSAGIMAYHDESLVAAPGVIVGRKGNVGSVFWSHDDFFPIDTVYYVESQLSLYFCYFALRYVEFINNDAAVPGLNRNAAYAMKIVVPLPEIAMLFEKQVRPAFATIQKLQKQNELLREARDILLPRLMTGMIDVDKIDVPTELIERVAQTE